MFGRKVYEKVLFGGGWVYPNFLKETNRWPLTLTTSQRQILTTNLLLQENHNIDSFFLREDAFRELPLCRIERKRQQRSHRRSKPEVGSIRAEGDGERPYRSNRLRSFDSGGPIRRLPRADGGGSQTFTGALLSCMISRLPPRAPSQPRRGVSFDNGRVPPECLLTWRRALFRAEQRTSRRGQAPTKNGLPSVKEGKPSKERSLFRI